MRKIIIPPGGFVGWGGQTPAVQALLARPGTRRKRKKKTTRRRKTTARRAPTRRAPARRRKTTARRKKPAYMVKGSPAAKRRMAQLRKMRKR